MASSVPKLALSRSRDIPFDQLVLSQANVRRLKCGVSIGELADDIVRRTLLQGLNVRAVLDGDGKETGKFEVPAGGRRFRALELLVTSKIIAWETVPLVVSRMPLLNFERLAVKTISPAFRTSPFTRFMGLIPFLQATAALRRRTASVAIQKFGTSASPANAIPSTNRAYSAS